MRILTFELDNLFIEGHLPLALAAWFYNSMLDIFAGIPSVPLWPTSLWLCNCVLAVIEHDRRFGRAGSMQTPTLRCGGGGGCWENDVPIFTLHFASAYFEQMDGNLLWQNKTNLWCWTDSDKQNWIKTIDTDWDMMVSVNIKLLHFGII